MKTKSVILCICLALLIPLSATAKKVRPAATAGCIVETDEFIGTDNPFVVYIYRDPQYTGQWFAPEITIDVSVPLDPDIEPGPNSYSTSVTQTVDGLGGSNMTSASFVIPYSVNLIEKGVVNIDATVSEPRGKKKKMRVVASCETTTSLP